MSEQTKDDEALNSPEAPSRRRGEQPEAKNDVRNYRKVREGVVASTAMDKTAVVEVTTRKPHPLYRKTMVRSRRFITHDEKNELRVGDRVRIAETRPLSKTKRWRLVEILERAK